MLFSIAQRDLRLFFSLRLRSGGDGRVALWCAWARITLAWPIPRQCAVRNSAMKREPNTVRSKDHRRDDRGASQEGVVV
jgi:hypothetical protein